MTHCYIAWGRQLNVPVVGVVTPLLLDWHFDPLGTPINLATDPSIFSPYVAPMTFFERLENFYTYHSVNRAFSKYSKDQEELVEKYFGPGFPSTTDMVKEVSLVLVNHDVSLSGIRPFSPIVIPVGGLHVVDHNETLPQVCCCMQLNCIDRFKIFQNHNLIVKCPVS